MEPKSVYVLVYISPDVHRDFVRIHGIFLNQEEAKKRRQEIFDQFGFQTEVKAYVTLDTL